MGSRLDRSNKWDELAEQAGYQVGKLSRAAGVGRRHLDRYFLAGRLCDPQSWLRELRLRRAKEMLMEGKPIKDIAPALKFKREASFYRFFLHLTGVTPHAYAQARQKNGSKPKPAACVGGPMSSNWLFSSSNTKQTTVAFVMPALSKPAGGQQILSNSTKMSQKDRKKTGNVPKG
jgi:AraC-like DNA-binding protein